MLLGLRTVEGVEAALLRTLGVEDRAADLAGQGFVSIADGRLVATPAGRPVLDAVLKALLVA